MLFTFLNKNKTLQLWPAPAVGFYFTYDQCSVDLILNVKYEINYIQLKASQCSLCIFKTVLKINSLKIKGCKLYKCYCTPCPILLLDLFWLIVSVASWTEQDLPPEFPFSCLVTAWRIWSRVILILCWLGCSKILPVGVMKIKSFA